MFQTSSFTDPALYKEYAIWMIVLAIVAFGFQYIKDIIAFMLDKLYQLYIESNSI
jgi:hypothetical protein